MPEPESLFHIDSHSKNLDRKRNNKYYIAIAKVPYFSQRTCADLQLLLEYYYTRSIELTEQD